MSLVEEEIDATLDPFDLTEVRDPDQVQRRLDRLDVAPFVAEPEPERTVLGERGDDRGQDLGVGFDQLMVLAGSADIGHREKTAGGVARGRLTPFQPQMSSSPAQLPGVVPAAE